MSDSSVDCALRRLAALGQRVVQGASVGALTTYRVGGPARILVTVSEESELGLVSHAACESGLPLLVVGRGSNLLVSDAGFPGIAVTLDPGAFSGIDVDGETVTAGAAAPLPALARQTVEAGLTGLEWAVGVPGSVGGGIRMNAGGHGSDVAHHLEACRMVDLGIEDSAVVEVALKDMRFAYRRSAVTASTVVVSGRFRLSAGDPVAGRETIREIVRWRREHQPGGQNAGSVFTNPPGTSAGWLIDAAGLKGRRWRSAEVSSKHANFIQADPEGSADDVRHLVDLVRAEVLRCHGVELEPEVRMIGFDSRHQPGDSPSTRELD